MVDKITPEDAAKRDAKEVADEFRDEIGKRISELTHDIPAEIATLRAAVEKAEWERDDAIATIKLLQQQLKIQNDSFAARLSEATRLAVKPLEWIGNKASSPVGQYKVKKMGGEWLAFKDGWTLYGSVPAVFASEEAAKAAAQADFERRILPALAAPTPPVNQSEGAGE